MRRGQRGRSPPSKPFLRAVRISTANGYKGSTPEIRSRSRESLLTALLGRRSLRGRMTSCRAEADLWNWYQASELDIASSDLRHLPNHATASNVSTSDA